MNKETKSLVLRNFTLKDITDEYIQALNDPEVVKYVDTKDCEWNKKKVTEYVKESNIEGVREFIGLFTKENEKHIGNIRLHYNIPNKRVDIATLIWDKNERLKGYGSEALISATDYILVDQGFYKIIGKIYESNKIGIRVFEKAGFFNEGSLKNHILFEGGYIDDYIYSKYK